MAGAAGAVRVEGLTELIESFYKADRGLAKEVRGELKDAGEVVRADGQGRAARTIHVSRSHWEEMRLGITAANVVYVVPKHRGRGGSSRRKNLAVLLMDRALEPALEANREKVVKAVEDAVNNVNQNAGLIRSLHILGE